MAVLALGMALAIGCDDDETTAPQAETFRATLNGANERPSPRTTPATGVATFTFRRDTLRWDITLANITNVTAGHIHIGDPNTAAGILLNLVTTTPNNTHLTGFVTRAGFTAPGAPNQGVTFDNLLTMMRAGNATYVNIHTNDPTNDPTNNSGPGDFPAGEIRGTIALAP
jgi:hypothetical protein